jgi:glycosyltransferase involved in cell wall biosynthesis
MKIAWLTPWSSESAIAEFSALVISELRRFPDVEVDVWYPAGAGGRTLPDPGERIGTGTAQALHRADAIVYNIGNHLGNHGAIHELSAQVPGTIILHDVVLTHMFLPALLRQSPDAMRRTLGTWYGEAGRREAPALRDDPRAWLWTEGNAEKFPMLQPVLEGADQVITHSEHAAERVREQYVGDVYRLGLPALHRPDDTPPPALDWLDERPVVLQAGAVNPNKCIPLVLEAFSEHSLGEHLQLVVAGHAEPGDRRELERFVSRAHLDGSVHILGTVDDATMQALRGRASIAMVLRSPVTEASSAVLVDSMAHGLATVALEVGHYTEHPSDVVQRLPLPPTSEAIGELLTRWALDPSIPAARGRAAAEYAELHHDARTYARELLEVLDFKNAIRRRHSLAAGAAELVRRNGFAPDSHLASRVAQEAALLFAGRPRQGRP